MSSELATPMSIAGQQPDEIVAARFLSRYREPTRSGYATSLKLWFRWCRKMGIQPMQVERAHIELWARELEEVDGNKPSTVCGKLNAVCGMYKYAQRDRFLEHNPAEWVERPTVPRFSSTNSLTRVEMLACLDAAKDSGPRDHALLCILGLNGLRVGEAIALDIEDLGMKQYYRTIKFTREKKAGMVDEMPLSPRTSHAIDQCIYGRDSGPLFLMRGLNGEPPQRMDRRAADRVVKRMVKAVGINKRITPHSFRHSFVTLSLDAGATVRDVQNSVGHADPRMVAYYDRNRNSLPRHATHVVSAWVEGS